MVDTNDFGSFAEAMSTLGTLNKLESAINSAIMTSKVPPKEIRKFMKCTTVEEASSTPLFQFMKVLFGKVGLGTLQLTQNDIFNYMFTIPDSSASRLYPNVKNKKVCYITSEAIQQFFEKDLGIPGNAEEIKCMNEGNLACEFSITMQPLAVYHHVLDKVDRGIIGGLLEDKDLAKISDDIGLHDEELKYKLDVLRRYHIVNDINKVTEIGATYHKYGRRADDEDEDFPPPWQDMSEISQAISASTSFAEAFRETNRKAPIVEEVDEDVIVNLTDEARKSTSFAELISRSIKTDDNKEG